MKKLKALAVVCFAVFAMSACAGGPYAQGALFSDYINTNTVQASEATIVVYRSFKERGLNLPIYLNDEVVGTVMPRGYIALTVPSSKEHILNTKFSGTIMDIRTAVTLNPGEVQYFKWNLIARPFAGKSQLVKVEEGVALDELKLSRNSI